MHRQSLPTSFDSADDRVLDGNHARVGIAVLDEANRGGKSRNRDVLDRMSPDLGDRRLGVSSAVPLERDAQWQVARVEIAVRVGFGRAHIFCFQHRMRR